MGSNDSRNISRIYLNNAASGYPKPREVLSAVNAYLRVIPENPRRSGFILKDEDPVSLCRQKLAGFFNIANPDNIIFTSGATESINLVVQGLELDKGHIITTVTEHNSVLRPLKRLERRGRIILSIIESDLSGKIHPEKIESQIQPNTKAIIINHCSHVTGQVQDIQGIAEVARRYDIWLIVDAAQSAGLIPIDISGTGIDILIFTGHKYLHGIPGIGGLYLSENVYLRPFKVGGTGIQEHSLYQPDGRPAYYEAGTYNYPGIVSISAGLDFILNKKIEKIRRIISSHICRIRKALENIPEIEIYGNPMPDSGILSFNIKGLAPSDAGYLLENRFGIIANSGLHRAPLIHRALGSHPQGTIRISPSFFTTKNEIDRLLEAVDYICSKRKTLADSSKIFVPGY